MINYGSIKQFKDVIAEARRVSTKFALPMPVLKFIGSVKLHGTNAAVVFHKDGRVEFQSRERVLTPEDDNAGFCKWGMNHLEELKETYDNIRYHLDISAFESIAIFGEWCGPGINKNVGINQLPTKMFVIFNITGVNGDMREELQPDEIKTLVYHYDDITTIYDFPTWEVVIDFNAPQLIQNQLVELTLEVEKECPVAKAFGISGTGEGIVWWNWEKDYKFKVKGEKHSVSRVKTVKEIAAVDIERMNSQAEFVDSVITENRLNQGLSKLAEMGLEVDIKNTGVFMKWVVNDALKEEAATIEVSNFDMKELGAAMSAKAKKFWFEIINKV